MGKVRVYELARELGMEDSKPLMRILRDMGYKVKTASSGLSPDAVRKIREVVAPHIEQARRDAEQKQKAEEAAKDKSVKTKKVKVRRAIRIVKRPSEAQKKALIERDARIEAGETVERSAAEAMEAAEEARRLKEAEERAKAEVLAKEQAEAEAKAKAEAEAKAAEAEEKARQEAAQAPEAVRTPEVRAEPVRPSSPPSAQPASKAPTKEEQEAQRRRELPPDQLIAKQYRPRTSPPPAGPPAATKDKPPARSGGGQRGPASSAKKGGPGGKRGPGGGRTREITQKSRAPRRPNHFNRGGAGKKRRRKRRSAEEKMTVIKSIEIPEIISLADLATKLEVPATDVIKYLLKQGKMVTKNQGLEYDDAADIVKAYGFKVKESTSDDDLDLDLLEDEEDPGDENRPPVVTVLGHVDHGKTSLLDAIRSTNVTEGEAGGITQSIGAYSVNFGEKKSVTFIDTPGHAAFTAMRARGAQVTDVAILVVAADDGVMPQTVEAINHVKAAKVPYIIAMNKIDKPDANPDRLMQQLAEHNIVVEDWGGEVPCVKVSALKRTGIDDLLEMISLVAELQELKADSSRDAKGIIIEAGLDKGLGPVATVLIQNGTLTRGDMVVVGDAYGRVRALLDDKGNQTKEAGPSIPVSIVGLSDVPESGDTLEVVQDEKMARQVSEARTEQSRKARIKGSGRTTLEDLFSMVKKGEQKELKLLVKGDTQGSIEAISSSLVKLTTDEVKVDIVHGAVGAISESDIMLASASDAIIIGFNVRPATAVRRMAEQENVELRLYKVIYHAIEEVEKAMTGLLAPEIKEVELGKIEVREVFKISKTGQVAGCFVSEGKVSRDAQIRVVRDGILIFEGKLSGLRRFKDDVKEVQQGYECGISIANFNDIQEGDIIEAFKEESVARASL